MKRFQKIIEDQYEKLGIVSEYGTDEDETEKDNEGQAQEVSKAKQDTDTAEDAAHDATLTAHKSRQNLAGAKKDKADTTSADAQQKTKQIGA